jgi:hypothetical protein
MIKKFLFFLLATPFLHIPATQPSTRSICKELSQITAPEKWDAPFLIKTSARLVDDVSGPLVELTPENAPHLTNLVKEICAHLKIPVPALYLNFQKGWFNLSQGSLSPSMAYIVFGKDFIKHPNVDDAEIIRGFLHECGHNVYNHNAKLSLATLTLIALWLIWITQSDQNIITKGLITLPYAIASWAVLMWYARFNEYMADRYEADNCEKPEEVLDLFKQRLTKIEKDDKASFLEELSYYFLENHPPFKDRLKGQITRLKERLSKKA